MFSLALQLSFEKSMKQQVVNNFKESTFRRNPAAAAFQYEKRSYDTLGTMAVSQAGTSRSEHDLARRRTVASPSSVPLQRYFSSKATVRTERPTSQFISQGSRQSVYTSNSTFPVKSMKLLKSSQPDGPITLPRPVVPEVTTTTREVSG